MELNRHIAKLLGLGSLKVPKLKVGNARDVQSATVWFLCPDFRRASGGIRKLYRCVDVLNGAGVNAAIIHSRRDFRCSWFENATRIVAAEDVVLGSRDVLVVPEVYDRAICDLPNGIRQIIFNQNVYNTLKSLIDTAANAAPYRDNPNLAFVLVVSEDNSKVIEHTFPGIPVSRLRLGVDRTLYYPPDGPKKNRIVYMPRRRSADAKSVLALLKLRCALDGWEVIAIDGRSEVEVAEMFRSAKVFLSFSLLEGFGLPPLEALACGCAVVGYHGFGGREYFNPPFAMAIEDGNIASFVHTAEVTIRRMNNDPNFSASIIEGAPRFVFKHYPMEVEKQDILDIFAPLIRS